MKLLLTTLAFAALAAVPALAAGDAEAGKKVFNQCQTCHVVANEAGEVLAGKGSKTGPNLYGVVGRAPASVEGFKYGDGIMKLAATGFIWSEPTLIEYVQNPTGFLDANSGDPKAKSKMMFKLKKVQDAENVVAFLASLAPAVAADPAAAPAADPAAAPAP